MWFVVATCLCSPWAKWLISQLCSHSNSRKILWFHVIAGTTSFHLTHVGISGSGRFLRYTG